MLIDITPVVLWKALHNCTECECEHSHTHGLERKTAQKETWILLPEWDLGCFHSSHFHCFEPAAHLTDMTASQLISQTRGVSVRNQGLPAPPSPGPST